MKLDTEKEITEHLLQCVDKLHEEAIARVNKHYKPIKAAIKRLGKEEENPLLISIDRELGTLDISGKEDA